MKSTFEVGQIIEAKILRVVDDNHVVVSLDGHYYQVETSISFKVGESIKLIVDSQNPLRLRIPKVKTPSGIHFRV